MCGQDAAHVAQTQCMAEFGAHQLIARAVPVGATVLDVGCAEGHLGSMLAEKGCIVDGLDRVDRVPLARRCKYRNRFDIDLNGSRLPSGADRKYDVIVCGDVLEHLVDPKAVLAVLTTHVMPQGLAIVSVPNVAHLSVRLNLLLGRFDYAPSGILDATHLHLYTVRSARRLMEAAGLRPVQLMFGSARFGRLLNWHPVAGRLLGGMLAYNIIIIARRK